MIPDDALSQFAQDVRQRVELALDARLPAADTDPSRLHEAMRYACLNGGKRIRAMLVHAAGHAAGAPPAALDVAAAAVEMIHAYSLVHDDLPAMDDDDLRRGRPTCHIAFDEATAILVGDGLQALAFETLARDPGLELVAGRRLRMLDVLTRAAGSRGMVGGQARDIAATGKSLSLADLKDLHRAKTGALIEAAVVLGALSSPRVAEPTLTALARYAGCIGLAFQIVDDILDEEGDTATLGKTSGADRARGKSTYPAVIGLQRSKCMAEELFASAIQALAPVAGETGPLRGLARLVIDRSH